MKFLMAVLAAAVVRDANAENDDIRQICNGVIACAIIAPLTRLGSNA